MRLAAGLVALTSVAHAGVVQAPEGGKGVPAVQKGVVCGPLAGGWTIDAQDRRVVVPPPAGTPNLARALEVKIADTAGGCATTKQTITLVAMGPMPELDPSGVT